VDGQPLGRLVSGWQLRALTAATVVLAGVLAVAGDAGTRLGPLSLVAGMVVVAGTALVPTTAAPTLGLLVIVGVVVDRSPPLAVVVVLAGLLHAVHLSASWCAAVPPSARLPVVALVPTVRRWALSQVLAGPVVLGVALAGGGTGRSTVAALGAGVVLLLLALLVMRTVRRVAGRAAQGGRV
jgi:hypothetical protein